MVKGVSWKERMKSSKSWLWKNACIMERKRMAQTILKTRTAIVILSTRKTRTYGHQNDGDYPHDSATKVLRTAVSRARSPMSHNPIAHRLRPLREATRGLRLCVLMLGVRQLMSNSILHTLPGAPLLQRSRSWLLCTRSGLFMASSKAQGSGTTRLLILSFTWSMSRSTLNCRLRL